ncbi:hypothetical protein EI555_015039 [Monodon monoceros]|uniref:Uncharacterized protein n=1 Tax=Monodon monoceros TaxID=40151 RepID=A0A4U1F863_MONMO|nr:hypothetical protein EI555_015039 [Monodon monoceros]
MAIWTENEVYLGYALLKFVKIITTEELKELLNMSSAATLTIHNVEYTGHPLELALLLNYCITCSIIKTIYLVIYNEDTKQWVFQDFALDVTTDTFLIPNFIYSALPELILWDKHRIYYYYHNFTDTGVLQTPTEFGNLSRLSHNSTIHDVFMDYYGNIVVKMENNVMFYFKINIKDAVKLHLWTNSTIKSLISLNTSDTRTQVFCLFTLDLVNMQKRVQYPKRFDKKECLQHDFFYIIEKYNDSGYVEDVEVNFIVWEIHGRDDYSFNNTMKKNYKHCFSYAIGKPGDLNQPYEIINKSNRNHLVWPLDHSGMYVFRVKILDPNYSFCNLTTIFAIETFGVIPRPLSNRALQKPREKAGILQRQAVRKNVREWKKMEKAKERMKKQARNGSHTIKRNPLNSTGNLQEMKMTRTAKKKKIKAALRVEMPAMTQETQLQTCKKTSEGT